MNESDLNLKPKPASRRLRRFYAKYMKWVVRGGFAFSLAAFLGVAYSFVHQVDVTIGTTPDAAGTVQAEFTEATLDHDVVLSRWLVEPQTEVTEGQPVMAVRRVDGEAGEEIVTAPTGGAIVPPPGKRLFAAGEPLCRICNYDVLVVEATLRGESVPQARLGLPARLSRVAVEPIAGTVLRAKIGVEGQSLDASSNEILGDQPRNALQEALKGQKIVARDDAPLAIESVATLEVEAAVSATRTRPGEASNAGPLGRFDLPTDQIVAGTVVSGTHAMRAQFAAVPSPAAQATREAVNAALLNRRLALGTLDDGESDAFQVQGVDSVRTVVQVDATAEATDQPFVRDPSAIPGTMIDRSFRARIRIDEASPFLREMVRKADREGHRVRAKVEVVTGRMPAAARLLRRN